MGRSTESPFTAMFLRPNIFWEKIQDELSSVITLTVSLEIRISQIFPRPGVQMDYSKGEKDHFVAIIKKKMSRAGIIVHGNTAAFQECRISTGNFNTPTRTCKHE